MANSNKPYIIVDLYTVEDNLQVFGITKPTLEQRAAYFEKCWTDWIDNEVTIGKEYQFQRYKLRERFGAYNYVMRGQQIRFCDKETLIKFLFDL